MSDASDEYAAFDFSEFTEEDFRQIDADIKSQANNVNSHDGPSLTIEFELESLSPITEIGRVLSPQPNGKQQRIGLTPYQEFRPGGVFSVTDLAAPTWCEVQFDYGLRQKRSRPVASRPKTFRSAQGKEISVKENVALKNDEITKQGKAIHKELEREIRLEELQVDISSHEERWALRLVNMLVCLKILLSEGKIREMPVFGILQDQLIVGIIDEIEKRPQENPLTSSKRSTETPQSPPVSKRSRRTPSPSQALITEFLPSTPMDSRVSRDPILFHETCSTPLVPPRKQHTLHLVDTKTRRSNTLPPFEDTLSSRIQLMLYHRLLRELMSVSKPFDFASLWERLQLRSSETFSTRFLVQAGLLVENGTFPMTSLDGLAKTWSDMVQKADVSMVDPNLTIVYRLQPATPRWNKKDKGKMRAQDITTDLGITQEESDLARAIEASLSDVPDGSAYDQRFNNLASKANEEPIPKPKPNFSDDAVIPADPRVPPPSDVHETDRTLDDMTIIGMKEFVYNEDFLDERLAHILRWWHGYRKPEGVSLQNSRRCFSCEYEAHCEWREQKAAEFRENRTKQDKPKIL